jgi:hypothetical protein
LVGDPAEILAGPVKRHLQSPVARPVPESTIAPVGEQGRGGGMLEARSAVSDDLARVDLLLDLEELIQRGASDEEIAEQLGMKDLAECAHARAWLADYRDALS